VRVIDNLAAAQTDGGAAAVAWIEDSPFGTFDTTTGRLLVALRPAAGEPFGAPIVVASRLPIEKAGPVVGIDAARRVTVAWIQDPVSPSPAPGTWVATVDATGHVTSRTRLPAENVRDLDLAETSDGRALLALTGISPQVFERTAGDGAFASIARLDRPGAGFSPGRDVSVTLGDDGAAVVAQTDGAFVWTSVRPAGGTFAASQPLNGIPPDDGSSGEFESLTLYRPGGTPHDADGADLSTALRPDGRAAVAWIAPETSSRAAAAMVATGTTTAGFSAPVRLGSACRSANGVQAIVLPDERLGVAWTDNADTTNLTPSDARGGGRLTLATADAPVAPAQPAPEPTVRVVGTARPQHPSRPLHLRIRCARGPCDVRAIATAWSLPQPGSKVPKNAPKEIADQILRPQPQSATVTAAVPANGATVDLPTYPGTTFALPERAVHRSVTVLACSPDGRSTAQTTVAAHLRGAALLPMPRILDVRVTRAGSGVRVRWRSAKPVHDAAFVLIGLVDPAAQGTGRVVRGHGRTSFSVTLSDPDGRRIRRVLIGPATNDGLYGRERRIRVP
jgi:hypothetical protein